MKLTFRKVSKKDLKNLFLIRKKNLNWLHKKRVDNQEKGKSEYLIFFKNKKPVAHLDIVLKSRTPYHDCPVLQDLYIIEKERGKGIAKEVLKLVEKYLRAKGIKKVAMDVEVKETWIKKFYLSRGFKVIGEIRSHSYFDEGENKRVRLRVFHLEKKL